MKDFGDKIKGGFNKSVKSIKGVVDNTVDVTFDKVKEGLEAIESSGKNTVEKSIEYVQEIIDNLPLYEKVGYRTTSIEIGISFPPSLEIDFHKFKNVNADEIDKLKQKYKDSKMFLLILNSLINASSFQNKISTENFESNLISVEITIPPKVSIKFKRRKDKGVKGHLE